MPSRPILPSVGDTYLFRQPSTRDPQHEFEAALCNRPLLAVLCRSLPFSADQGHEGYWSNPMQSVVRTKQMAGQVECKQVVKRSAISENPQQQNFPFC